MYMHKGETQGERLPQVMTDSGKYFLLTKQVESAESLAGYVDNTNSTVTIVTGMYIILLPNGIV